MSVIGMNFVGLTRQTDSYTAVGTTQSTGQTKAMDFAGMIAGMMNGQLNTRDQSDAGVIRANADGRTQSAGNAEDGIKKSSVGLQKTSFSTTGTKQSISGMKASDGSVSDEDCEKAMEVVATVLGRFAEILGVSVEELQGAFEQLGIDIDEMLNTDNVAKLVLLLNGGEDISDMLMDEDMLGSFNDMLKAIDSILDEAGMDKEAFAKITSSDIFTELTKETETKNPVGILKKLESTEDDNVENKTVEPEDKDIRVTYSKTKETEDTSEGKSKEDGAGADASSDRRTSARTLDDGVQTSSTVTGVNGFINSMQNAVKSTSLDNMLAEMGTSVRDIVFQLTDAIKVNIGGDKTSLEMQLTPENLGRVQLNISSKDGVMTAHITTENQTAREAIESQLQTLKEHITEQGFKVDAIEVSVSNFSFTDSRNAAHSDEEQGRPTQKGGHRLTGSIEEAGSPDVAEDIRREVMLQTGSTVSYVA